MTDTSDEFEVIPSFFQDSNLKTIYDLGDNDAESPNAEIDDEHIRNASHIVERVQNRTVEGVAAMPIPPIERKIVEVSQCIPQERISDIPMMCAVLGSVQ